VTIPSTYVYICEQKCVHKRSQRRLQLNLATRDIFRIFTMLEQVSTGDKIKVMTQATMHSHSVLEKVIYQLQDKGAIVDPCIVDDLITCIKTHKIFEFK